MNQISQEPWLLMLVNGFVTSMMKTYAKPMPADDSWEPLVIKHHLTHCRGKFLAKVGLALLGFGSRVQELHARADRNLLTVPKNVREEFLTKESQLKFPVLEQGYRELEEALGGHPGRWWLSHSQGPAVEYVRRLARGLSGASRPSGRGHGQGSPLADGAGVRH